MEANERLSQLLNLAKEKGIVRTQAQFAELIDTAPSTLSSCLKGGEKYKSTAVTFSTRAENALMRAGIPIKVVMGETQEEPTTEIESAIGSEDDDQTIAALAETVRSQQKTIEALLKKYVLNA